MELGGGGEEESGQEPGEVFGMSRTKVAIKLIVLGLAAFIGLLVFYLYEKGGG